MTTAIEKILETIPNPDDCRCAIAQYKSSHSLLMLEVLTQNSGKLYLAFEEVEYIKCPISWKGAHIYLGTQEQCIEILNQLNKGFEKLPTAFLAEKYHLYKFQNQVFEICILANSIYLVNESTLS